MQIHQLVPNGAPDTGETAAVPGDAVLGEEDAVWRSRLVSDADAELLPVLQALHAPARLPAAHRPPPAARRPPLLSTIGGVTVWGSVGGGADTRDLAASIPTMLSATSAMALWIIFPSGAV